MRPGGAADERSGTCAAAPTRRYGRRTSTMYFPLYGLLAGGWLLVAWEIAASRAERARASRLVSRGPGALPLLTAAAYVHDAA